MPLCALGNLSEMVSVDKGFYLPGHDWGLSRSAVDIWLCLLAKIHTPHVGVKQNPARQRLCEAESCGGSCPRCHGEQREPSGPRTRRLSASEPNVPYSAQILRHRLRMTIHGRDRRLLQIVSYLLCGITIPPGSPRLRASRRGRRCRGRPIRGRPCSRCIAWPPVGYRRCCPARPARIRRR